MADSISAFFASLMPDFKAKAEVAPSKYDRETRTVGSSSATKTSSAASTSAPVSSAEGTSATRPTAVSGRSTDQSSSSNSEEVRRQREKFLNEKFGSGKSKGAKAEKIIATKDNTPTSAEVLAWN